MEPNLIEIRLHLFMNDIYALIFAIVDTIFSVEKILSLLTKMEALCVWFVCMKEILGTI
ncbi:hypothetical protein GCM10010918_10060 [Paenibacillus radicis (ex Gao et al. 2016)]|uniref:Uncharacterized protein n=1 Tax=Paenibacillus radicis (ex Gao et al. 2016) TaxID=1737354 RepID=A0A917GX42_9BACL|nr:hypothetical protein GCM10010918_10060 [Paenibacillus radicis (ex Gao et al. 2016)]